jgi:type II secretory pathway component PulF
MSVYRYLACDTTHEDHTQSGTIVAASEEEAKRKLRQRRFDKITLKRVDGLSALLHRFTADIK